MKLFSTFLLSLILISCNKPDPNPELRDPIYLDLVASTTSINTQLEAEKKTLEENKKALDEVVLQSGQNLFAGKHIMESKNRITKLEQEKQYLELKTEEYKKTSKRAYLNAFKKGDSWPDPKEWNAYQLEKKLLATKKQWDVKTRINEFNGKSNKKGSEAEPSSHH
ncbi:MAG: hypothetical protein ACXVCY_07045 [Pseudobdellovibrionaceae bacterium]